MRRHRDEIEDARVETTLARLWRRLPAPTADQLEAIAHAARSEPRSAGSTLDRPRWRLRPRWAVAVMVVAALVGTALGFGLAGSVTPSGSAGGNMVGFGFLPAQGWNVMQSGTLGPDGVARAITANVPLDPKDGLSGAPRATIASLPVRGVLIVATFRPRGDPMQDFKFTVRESPLRLGDAISEPSDLQTPSRGAWYDLRAAVGGYNVDLRIYFGTPEPSADALASAQRQLNRLVVAAERVTIFAVPTVAGNRPLDRSVRLFGSVESGKSGESVSIQAKDCGTDYFRLVAGATTESGGSWSTIYWPGINTTVRAVWNGVSSAQISIRARAGVYLLKKRDGKTLRVWAFGKRNLWRKRVEIQRLDARLGIWKRLRTVVLTDQEGNRGSGPLTGQSGSSADFRPAVPKGTLLRAVMPLSQAKPCYLAGTSQTVRT